MNIIERIIHGKGPSNNNRQKGDNAPSFKSKHLVNGIPWTSLHPEYDGCNIPPHIRHQSSKQKINTETYVERVHNQFQKQAEKRMKKISKHINTQKFNEYFVEHIGVDVIGAALRDIIINEDERTENKLKAIQEVNKYNFIPSQAQEIKHEVDDSFDEDRRERLKELLAKMGDK